MLKEPGNILVINLKYIGDTLWMYPFIKNLKLNFPHAPITALVNSGCAALLELMPELSGVIEIDRGSVKGAGGLLYSLRLLSRLRAEKFDTVFILSSSDRATFTALLSGAGQRVGFISDSRLRALLLTKRSVWRNPGNPHFVEYNLKLLRDNGLKIFDTSIALPLPDGLSTELKKRLSITTGKKRVIVHPGSRNPLRNWGTGHFAEVINALGKQYAIFVAAGPSETEVLDRLLKGLDRKPEVVTTGLNLIEFAALCSTCDLFIGNDSAPIHIAAATGTHVIGIYGPTLATICGPWTDKKSIFDDETVACKLCDQKRCYNDTFKVCFKKIEPKAVIEEAFKVLEGRSG